MSKADEAVAEHLVPGAPTEKSSGEKEQGSPVEASLDLDGLIGGQVAVDFEQALRLRSRSVVPVDEPLALISQVQRSGGTLLTRLFDGHPQCHVHPHELQIGDEKRHEWPRLRLDGEREEWFRKLQEDYLGHMFVRGKRRIPAKAPGQSSGEGGTYPFILPPPFQRYLFLEDIKRRSPITSEREILNSYMTSLFNAWLDNQNLTGRKEWVVTFSPRRSWGQGLTRFFKLYKDGRLISILRDPLGWYASERVRDERGSTEDLLEVWKTSALEMLDAANEYGKRVYILRFDSLILDTEKTMRRMARFLGIDFDPILATPTFNRYPVGANSSFGTRETGILKDPVRRYKQILSEEQQDLIRRECWDLYNEVRRLTR